MTKSRIKTIVIFLFLFSLSVALYLTSQRHKWNSGWDKGLLSISERNYYSNRIIRILKNWYQTAREPDVYNEDILPESYQTYLIIDLEKKAIWVEENGLIKTENYIDLSPEIKWFLYHITPEGSRELPGRTSLKISGLNIIRLFSERFYLVGQGQKGHLVIEFNMYHENTYYDNGKYVMRSINMSTPMVSADKIYPSLIVTKDKYKKYLDTISDSNVVAIENEKIKAWNKIEKYLYMEIERQFPKKGYNLTSTEIKPGPDYSAARAYINIRKKNILEKITGRRSKHHGYSIYIDHLGDDIWYGKSVYEPYSDPSKTEENKPELDIEFITSPNGFIKGSRRKKLLKKGKEFQLAASIPKSKWKAILPDGKTIEFLGICDNPTVNKQWWGPDGSPLDFAPYMSTETYRVYKENRTCYEIVWRVTPSSNAPFIFEGSEKVYHTHIIRDRYGNVVPGIIAYSFDNSRNVTTLKIGYGGSDWKTALEVINEAKEINFLDKYPVKINPPEIKNGKILIQCSMKPSQLMNYITDFAIVVKDGVITKTISLNQSQYRTSSTGYGDESERIRYYNYNIEDIEIDRIESVCFRYRPYSAIFKNISLVPGEDYGFEIEVIEAEE